MTLPLHLSVGGRNVVVVGGGRVGARKVSSCLAAGARIVLISPAAHPAVVEQHRAGLIQWRSRSYRPGDLDGAWLVFTATGNPTVDREVEDAAFRQRMFCVRADDAGSGTARSPAVLRQDGLVISVGTDASPLGALPMADPRRVVAVRDAIAGALDDGTLRLPAVSPSRRTPARPL